MNKTTKKPARAAVKARAVDQEPLETTAYRTGACPILLDGELYQPGDEIALTQQQAERLGKKVVAIVDAADPTKTLE